MMGDRKEYTKIKYFLIKRLRQFERRLIVHSPYMQEFPVFMLKLGGNKPIIKCQNLTAQKLTIQYIAFF